LIRFAPWNIGTLTDNSLEVENMFWRRIKTVLKISNGLEKIDMELDTA